MASKLDLDGDGKVSKWEMFPYWFDKLRIFPIQLKQLYHF